MLTTQRGKLLMKIRFSEQPSGRSCVINLREKKNSHLDNSNTRRAGYQGLNPDPDENYFS